MKLFHSLVAYACAAPFNATDDIPIGYATDFGINYVDCDEYFVHGETWPLSTGTKAKAGKVVKLCQNVYKKKHYYATLYSVDDRIPVYSGKSKRQFLTSLGAHFPKWREFAPFIFEFSRKF